MWIVSGFSFIKVYHFIALKQNESNAQNVFLSSLVSGYIICSIANQIPISINEYVDNVCIVLASVSLGFLAAKLVLSTKIKPVLEFLKILDTGNVYIWDDLMDKKYPMKVSVKVNGQMYVGMVHNIESYSNSPHITLASYIVYNENGNIIKDFSSDVTRVIILDTSLATEVEIIYNAKSDECEDIKLLVTGNLNERNFEKHLDKIDKS